MTTSYFIELNKFLTHFGDVNEAINILSIISNLGKKFFLPGTVIPKVY